MQNLYIESEEFHGITIFGSNMQPYGYGLEHVRDVNTNKVYTIIFKGDKRYSYEEDENGNLIPMARFSEDPITGKKYYHGFW